MAAKKTSRAKGRKIVAKAKPTRKSAVRSARKAPKLRSPSETGFPPESIDIF